MSKLAKNAIIIALATILLATASWAVYRMFNQGAGDLLALWGITNIYYQSLIVIVVVVVLLLLVGFGGKAIIKKVLRL